MNSRTNYYDMKKVIIYILLLLSGLSVSAQTELTNLNPEEYFNFWLGSWDLTWKKADRTIGKGENKIEKILDGNVIQENFKVTEDPLMKNFTGKSWTVYNKNNGLWYQTWVDNQGAYLDFIGEFEDNKRIFKRKVTSREGKAFLQRMVFYDIQTNSFSWDWEISFDNGKSWILKWRIKYQRKEAAQ